MANIIVGTRPNQVPRNSDLGQLAYLNLEQINLGFMQVREQQASGTHGGASTASTFHTRTLNTVVVNTIRGASLAANIVTLVAGTYYIEALAPAKTSNLAKLSVYNDTDAVDLLVGTNAGSGLMTTDSCSGQIVLTSTKGIKLRHWIGATVATDGLGGATSNGQVEVYASMRIWKVA